MNKIEFQGKGNKNILILTGVHGNELTPVYCSYLLNNYFKNVISPHFKKLTILNSINLDGIRENIRDIPNDSTSDINRMFKQEPYNFHYDEMKSMFDEHDVIIDVHSSPNCCEFILLNQNETTNSYVEFALKYNIKYLIRYSNTNTIKKYGLDNNKISFTVELNKVNFIDVESSGKGADMILDIINHCDDFELKEEEPKYCEFFEYYTYKEGLFIPYKGLGIGDVITKDECFGHLLDLKTLKLNKIYYTKDISATIICTGSSQYVSSNNSIYYLQPKENYEK